jgi:hypothetical protein
VAPSTCAAVCNAAGCWRKKASTPSAPTDTAAVAAMPDARAETTVVALPATAAYRGATPTQTALPTETAQPTATATPEATPTAAATATAEPLGRASLINTRTIAWNRKDLATFGGCKANCHVVVVTLALEDTAYAGEDLFELALPDGTRIKPLPFAVSPDGTFPSTAGPDGARRGVVGFALPRSIKRAVLFVRVNAESDPSEFTLTLR